MKLHYEKAFEDEVVGWMTAHGGWALATGGYDAERGLILGSALGFIEAARPNDWAYLCKVHGAQVSAVVGAALEDAVERKGTLHVLRQGFKVKGRRVEWMVAWPPESDVSDEVSAQYGANRFEVMRQVSPGGKGGKGGKGGESVDVVLFVNGLPVVTVELKAKAAGQSFKDAVKQYMARKTYLPLFRWGRAVVHFAVGTEAAAMTTRVEGDDTRFLPFNRGREDGSGGNDHVEGKARTHYLWEEVLTAESVVELLQRFAHVRRGELKADGSQGRDEVIFPRYHQRDAVRWLVGEAHAHGAGHNWLVQHSAGSGKSMTIGWLALRLASLHGADGERVYDKVVVLSDRRLLDGQLGATIDALSSVPGDVVAARDHSSDLAAALAGKANVVVSTIQKFGHVHGAAAQAGWKRFAVIVDEAHSSQSGEMARDVRAVLGGSGLDAAVAEELASMEDAATEPGQAALAAALSRGRLANLSYFAFTATPVDKTLELFGHRGPDGKPLAHHLYSMRQAIDEGFIVDVLKGYTEYRRYYRLAHEGEDDREVQQGQARRALARFVDLHETNIAQKVEVIVEHFVEVASKRIGGQAKAMVVCSSRLQAVRYHRQIKAYAAEHGYDFGCLVAFSGAVVDGGESLTEAGINGFGEKQLPGEFRKPAWRMLVVADKYQTGFDEPLLHTMYVDKPLRGITAVQTLSRLNRCHRDKEDTRVIDFKNDAETIKEAFQKYYEVTTTAEVLDAGKVERLEGKLGEAGVLVAGEMAEFAEVFYGLPKGTDPVTHGGLVSLLGPAVERFGALRSGPDDEVGERRQDEFRAGLARFVERYAYIAQLRQQPDSEQERLYVFGQFLLRMIRAEGEGFSLGDEVDVAWLRLRRGQSSSLALEAGQVGRVPVSGGSGSARADEPLVLLSSVIESLNERFGEEAAARVADLIDEAGGSARLKASAAVNTAPHFAADAEEVFEGLLADEYAAVVEEAPGSGRAQFVEAFFSDAGLQSEVMAAVLEQLSRRFAVGQGGDAR